MPLRILVILSLLCLALPGFAARSLELYDEQAVLAQDASQSDQDEAVAEALARVLVRVTGDESVTADETVESALDDANDYLATFRFESSDITLTNVLGESVPTKRMIMRFDRSAVEELLVDNRLPVWGDNRPETLIWLADRLDGTDHILSDTDAALAETLKSYSRLRGIPLILPIMDLTDTLNVSFTDVYGLFSSSLETASDRYAADATLIGRVSRQGEGYQANFIYRLGNERRRYQVSADSRDGLMQALVDQIAARLADQYAVVLDPAMAGQLSLRVEAIDNLTDLAEVERFLSSLNLVTRVTLRRVEDQSLVFDLAISGDRGQFRDTLALEDRLVAVEEAGLGSQLDSELVYRWSSGPGSGLQGIID